MSFEKIIGNDDNKKLLENTVRSNNVLHSYLFFGTEGIGKKVFAKEFSKMILCNSKDEKPCNKCKSCIEFDSNNNPDFFVIEPDGSSIKIEQIRQMQKSILEKPIESNKKVYIINDAETMTKEAQNCMLKTLEEPQDFIVIILIASNENNILPTVKSRCTKIFFRNLDDADIIKYVNEKNSGIDINKDILKLCNGSILKAEFVIQKIDILDKIKDFVMNIDKQNELVFFQNNELFYNNKDDIILLLEYVNILLFEKIKGNLGNINGFINSMKIVESTKLKLINSNNYDMTIDNMLLKMWEEINEKNYRG